MHVNGCVVVGLALVDMPAWWAADGQALYGYANVFFKECNIHVGFFCTEARWCHNLNDLRAPACMYWGSDVVASLMDELFAVELAWNIL